MWAQYAFGDGPRICDAATVLFCLWLARSRFRVVLPLAGQPVWVRRHGRQVVITCVGDADPAEMAQHLVTSPGGPRVDDRSLSLHAGQPPSDGPDPGSASGRADRRGAGRQARRLGRSGRERRCHDGVRGGGSSWRGRSEDDLLAAAGGPAPEGGTASSASAKVPRGRLAPRRSRTPTRGGIKRHGACTGF